MPTRTDSNLSPIEIGSLPELRRHEREIVRRVNAAPNGGRLFLADPVRCLNDVNVHLSPDALQQFVSKLGTEELANNPLSRLYDVFKQDPADQNVLVTIHGILPKEG